MLKLHRGGPGIDTSKLVKRPKLLLVKAKTSRKQGKLEETIAQNQKTKIYNKLKACLFTMANSLT